MQLIALSSGFCSRRPWWPSPHPGPFLARNFNPQRTFVKFSHAEVPLTHTVLHISLYSVSLESWQHAHGTERRPNSPRPCHPPGYLRDLQRSVVGSHHFRQSLDMFMENPGNPRSRYVNTCQKERHTVIAESLKLLNCFRLISRYRLQLQLRPYRV